MKAVFSGSFDPITRGHVDIVTRARNLVDEVIVGVAVNTAKNGIFSMDERVSLVRDAVKDIPQVSVHLVMVPTSSSVACDSAATSTTSCRWPTSTRR